MTGWRRWAATGTRSPLRSSTRAGATTAGAFTQSFGSDDLDASNLMIPIVGFLPADDPRVLATIDAIEKRLTDERGLVYRYLAADGLEGEEGTFLLCTFWLAQALAMSGQPARAREVFDRAAAFVNDVGLLAEEVDPHSDELLGNFPQAFSHIGLDQRRLGDQPSRERERLTATSRGRCVTSAQGLKRSVSTGDRPAWSSGRPCAIARKYAVVRPQPGSPRLRRSDGLYLLSHWSGRRCPRQDSNPCRHLERATGYVRPEVTRV